MIKAILVILSILNPIVSIAKNDDEFKNSYLCFDKDLVKVDIERDRVQWPSSDFTNVCSIGITINMNGVRYFYYSRGWRYPQLCKQFVENWNRYIKTNKKICIAARLDPLIKIEKGKKTVEQSAPYEIIRIGNWCHSYFDGYCE